MTLRLKVGTVTTKADVTQTGKFKVSFKGSKNEKPLEEDVTYVSPYGSNQSAFVAIPDKKSEVICLYDDAISQEGDQIQGYYYLGSVIGPTPGANRLLPPGHTPPVKPSSVPYIEKTSPGGRGTPAPPGVLAEVVEKNQSAFPDPFQDMYGGKGIIPEMMGFTNLRADSVTLSNRSRGNTAANPFQDYKTSLQSGSGKRFALIDSPTVDGIVMTNEHRGVDYMIWSSGMSEQSPFAEGEVHWRTHGPFNLYTLWNRFHIWVEDGLNIEIENKSTGSKSPNKTRGKLGPPGTGGASGRISTFGDESTGCIQLWSHHNNVSVSALEEDSVIHLHAPGTNSRVIVHTGGTVDIVAEGKITLQSGTEVEINAPEVDINALGGNVYIDGSQVHLNQPHAAPQL